MKNAILTGAKAVWRAVGVALSALSGSTGVSNTAGDDPRTADPARHARDHRTSP
ncbi:hypothetical protein [Microbacterium sp. TNHR37B]|uniref:hypothetical protein n=1 Tax=Microbacterium sp. TNHR37B TaxID=1775956 RepID=UPI0007B235E2|nr:hypothetical protein [Microbacterium sp. TNHR37B]KZE89943.1 hypothetical protein AVP41_02745 [Microbacterium sp. TNHR37B]